MIATITPLGFKNWKRKVSIKFTGFKFSFVLDDLEKESQRLETIKDKTISKGYSEG